ncbi:MAG: hypothetical protein ACREQO_19675 [Candidatus Binatia bacterium]
MNNDYALVRKKCKIFFRSVTNNLPKVFSTELRNPRLQWITRRKRSDFGNSFTIIPQSYSQLARFSKQHGSRHPKNMQPPIVPFVRRQGFDVVGVLNQPKAAGAMMTQREESRHRPGHAHFRDRKTIGKRHCQYDEQLWRKSISGVRE